MLVDTSVLSLALRRRDPIRLSERERLLVAEFIGASDRGEVALLGVIRQELLSGVRHQEQFDRLRRSLDGYHYFDVTLTDHDLAAEYTNQCRAAGLSAGDIDMLICAVAVRADVPVFTTDGDFKGYARHVPVVLHDS